METGIIVVHMHAANVAEISRVLFPLNPDLFRILQSCACVDVAYEGIHNDHYTTAKAIYSVAQEREIEGMLCWRRLMSQKQRCTELPLFLFSLRHMVD